MPKVVKGTDFDKFVQTGEHQTIDAGSKKPEARETPKSEEAKAAIAEAEAATAREMEPKADVDTGLEPGDEEFSEKTRQRIQTKHGQLKDARALANKLKGELEDTENFSKTQYQRAQLAEEKASNLERELADLRAKAPTVEAKDPAKPDPKDFYDDKGQFKAFEYAEKLAEFAATEAVSKDRKRQTEERNKAQADEVIKAFNARLERAREKYPDFREVVGGADVHVPPYIQQYMVESDFGGDLGYYFAKNPAETDRIFKLSPIKAIAAIGKLETQWEAKTETKAEASVEVKQIPKVSAPAPITPLSGTSGVGVNTDPAKMSPKELLAYTREKEASKRRRG